MALWQFQSSLNSGVLTKKLAGRIDIDSYYKGVSQGDNVLSQPQGGMIKRPGMEYIGTAYGDGRLIEFEFSTEQTYVFVFTESRIQFYKAGVLQVGINGTAVDYLTSPYTAAQAKELRFTQSADTTILVHEDHPPRTLKRLSDTDWQLADITFTDVPQFDFDDSDSPAPTSEIQDFTVITPVPGDRYKIQLDNILTEELVWADDRPTNAARMQEAIQDLPNTGTTGVTVAHIVANQYRITLAGDSADNYDEITMTPILTANATFRALTTTVQNGVPRKEDVWSAVRGYPRTATFHEGRLFFGGTKSRPQSIYGSRVNDFFSFRNSKGLPDEAIDVTLNVGQINPIVSIFSDRHLQIFTTGAEFYIPARPITPETISVPKQTALGSAPVQPVNIDGATIYAQRTGSAIRQFLYTDAQESYISDSISVLSADLINNPIAMAAARGTVETDASYCYVLMGDGTISALNLLGAQSINAWSRWITNGTMTSICVSGDRLHALVSRTLSGVTTFTVERENPALYMDACNDYQFPSTMTTITGCDHLVGYTVKLVLDGFVQPDIAVTSGAVTLPRAAKSIQIGHGYSPTIKTMAINVGLEGGPQAAEEKRIVRVSLSLLDSLGVIVNNERLLDREFGVNLFGVPAEPFTGRKEIYLGGWSVEAFVTITQEDPLPFNVLDIGMEIET